MKNITKSYSVFHMDQKEEFCLFVDFLRCSCVRVKVILTVVEREYKPDITRQICFLYKIRGFLNGFPNRLELYFRKPLLFRKCTRLLF